MPKISQADVVKFLKDRITQIEKELESTKNALSIFLANEEIVAPVKRGRRPKSATTAAGPVRKTRMVKPGGKKRGRKPKNVMPPPPESEE